MKYICNLITWFLLMLIFSGKSYSQNPPPVLEELYFGQKPPTNVAELFPPDAVFSKSWDLGG